MAVSSGMHYDKVEELISYIEGRASAIDATMEHLIGEVPPKIANAYSGEAAETYKATLKKCSTMVQDTIRELIDNLKSATEEKKTSYTQQDQRMQESAEV